MSILDLSKYKQVLEAPDIHLEVVQITPDYVTQKLGSIAGNKDLSQYIL